MNKVLGQTKHFDTMVCQKSKIDGNLMTEVILGGIFAMILSNFMR